MSRDDAIASFGPPQWLREAGRTSWLLVGLLVLLGGLMWLIGATFTIVGPVLGGLIVAVVAMPIADRLARHMPRAAAAGIVLVSLVVLAAIVLVVVLAALIDQRDAISAQLTHAVDTVKTYAEDVGVNTSTADSAGATASETSTQTVSTLVHGLVDGIKGLASLAFGLSFAALSIFFLLKDGHMMQDWIGRHAGLPEPVARVITDDLGTSLRGYFKGVTIVAAFNGVVVTVGALLLGVPLAGTIGVVTFVTAYVPYVGAFVAGAFAVLIALGANGATTAVIMLIIVLLANGLLQNILQPFAMGSALKLNPLVVLIVTIGAGCLFGTLGMVLAAPLLSAATRIPGDLRQLRAPPSG